MHHVSGVLDGHYLRVPAMREPLVQIRRGEVGFGAAYVQDGACDAFPQLIHVGHVEEERAAADAAAGVARGGGVAGPGISSAGPSAGLAWTRSPGPAKTSKLSGRW